MNLLVRFNINFIKDGIRTYKLVNFLIDESLYIHLDGNYDKNNLILFRRLIIKGLLS